jgi:hypothetical protein
MVALPPKRDFLFMQDAPGAGFAQAADEARRRIARRNRNAKLGFAGRLTEAERET